MLLMFVRRRVFKSVHVQRGRCSDGVDLANTATDCKQRGNEYRSDNLMASSIAHAGMTVVFQWPGAAVEIKTCRYVFSNGGRDGGAH